MPTRETIDPDTFDFGFDSFRPMGFTFTGIVESAKVGKPEKDTFTFTDSRTGQEVTREAKPQLTILVRPTDHTTKTGNPYPEYYPLTHNTRSKLGIAIQHFRDLGINLGSNPEQIEGMEFEWERKEVEFGGRAVQVLVPIGLVDDLNRAAPSTNGATPAPAKDPFESLDLEGLASRFHGLRANEMLKAVGGTEYASNPKLIGALADGSFAELLIARGLMTKDGDVFLAAPVATAA